MDRNIFTLQKEIWHKHGFEISNIIPESESQEYSACRFQINELEIIFRNSKITPKKTGQFVTFWKRDKNGITTPYHENDSFDFYIIHAIKEAQSGLFILSKETLADRGIISTRKKDGKRGFRVYPPWDQASSKQAEKTQKWQSELFIELNEHTDKKQLEKLLSK